MTAKLPANLILEEKYTTLQGRAFLSGTQALVRLPMLQKLQDRQAGLNTAGYISGYRGSPLGSVDQQLWQAEQHLAAHDIVFQPGLNEDLAATAVWGTQQINLYPDAQRDGIFGMWYGKGPGADRSTDAIKHANLAGTAPHGGVLMVVGDDHAAKSSTVAHQSEHLLSAMGVPVLYPSNVQEILDFGLHGWAMSRFAGLWVGLKCVTQVVETTASVEMNADRVKIILPQDVDLPEDGLHIRWPDAPLAQEARMVKYKWYAALAYVRANRLNQVVIDSPQARFGIMTAGKAYQDVRQALLDLGLDEAACRRIGVRVMKVGCVWPLDAQDARHFSQGLDEILVVEEKRQILEYALKEELYNWRDDVRPRVYGKFDARDNAGGEWAIPHEEWLLPATAELSPSLVAKAIAKRLSTQELPEDIRSSIAERLRIIEQKERENARPRVTTDRLPWFCSGCPHNTSTRVPEGSRAMAGIGCHYMARWMDRNTSTYSHMGGEGAAWLGQMHFSADKHIFVNLGDGTYFHSGLLAIRAAVSAKANMTYKILFNDAVAMTGGQPMDGPLSVPQLARQVLAEGVSKIVIVSDDPASYRQQDLPAGVDVFHRDELDAVQRQLRETTGTTVLIYQQMCATEKRRRRKRGTLPVLTKRTLINEAVCEGCGDCSKASNCLSIEPVTTPFGTKRRINQSSCNQDFSCVKGFCPSFVTVEGAELCKPQATGHGLPLPDDNTLPVPALPELDKPYRILVTGVGGTGIVTIGALLGMAAHLEQKGVSVLDMAGLAQKGGAVLSHIQLAPRPEALSASHIPMGEANLLLGCDSIVSASRDALAMTLNGLTRAVINSNETPTSDFIHNRNWTFPGQSVMHDLQSSLGEHSAFLDASTLALTLLGDTLYANSLLLGFAWQHGWIPLQLDSLLQAIAVNGVQVDKNRQAFQWGRHFAHHGVPDNLLNPTTSTDTPIPLDDLIEQHARHLSNYQSPAYAQRYRKALQPLRAAEDRLGQTDYHLTRIAARQLGKLMAYKDEYEVARLYNTPEYLDKLRATFAGEPGKDYQLKLHLAPPLLSRKDSNGHARKRAFGGWVLKVFPLLARLKVLRGTPLDVFGYTAERRQERDWVQTYQTALGKVAEGLMRENVEHAAEWLDVPEQIRGFGHVKLAGMEKAKKAWERLEKF